MAIWTEAGRDDSTGNPWNLNNPALAGFGSARIPFDRRLEINGPQQGGGAKQQYSMVYIEDTLSSLRLIERIVRARSQVELISAMNATDGLAAIYKHKPNLVLLDLHLPDMSGQEVLKQLQRDERTRNITVAVISADAMPEQIEQLFVAGASYYLTKPIDVVGFLNVLDKLLAAYNQQLSPNAS